MRHLQNDDVKATLTERERVLSATLQSFLNRKCGWALEDTPPLSEFELDDLEGESDDVA